MKIQKVLQLNSVGYPSLKYGMSIQSEGSSNTKYCDPTDQVFRVSGGWDKDRWLGLCSNFRLEFVYG